MRTHDAIGACVRLESLLRNVGYGMPHPADLCKIDSAAAEVEWVTRAATTEVRRELIASLTKELPPDASANTEGDDVLDSPLQAKDWRLAKIPLDDATEEGQA